MGVVTIWDLLGINWNIITMTGLIIGVIVILYFLFRIMSGFINPLNSIDKLVLIIALITIAMVWGYSIFQNILYTTIGKALFFGALILVLTYFVLFYGKKKVGVTKTRKTSTYKTIVTRK